MGLHENYQKPGGIKKDTGVTDDQEPKANFTNANVTDANYDTDSDIVLNYYAILEKLILLL